MPDCSQCNEISYPVITVLYLHIPPFTRIPRTHFICVYWRIAEKTLNNVFWDTANKFVTFSTGFCETKLELQSIVFFIASAIGVNLKLISKDK